MHEGKGLEVKGIEGKAQKGEGHEAKQKRRKAGGIGKEVKGRGQSTKGQRA